MWELILRFLNKLLDLLRGNPADSLSEVSGKASIAPDKPPVSTGVSPATPKTETPTYQEIDWEHNPPQYHKRKSLLSFQEREFYRLVRGQVGNQYHVFAAVRMGDVLWLEDETDKRKFFNSQILCKHFDYVICDKLKFEPLVVIELDDSSHQWENRWQNDQFKQKACERAGLLLLRVEVQPEYNREEIGQKIRNLIKQAEGTAN